LPIWQQPVPEGTAKADGSARTEKGRATTMAGRPPPDGGMTVPVPVAGAVLIGTSRYGLFLVSPRNGKVIDGLDVGSGFAQTPAVYGNRAFVMSNSGTLLALAI